MADKKVTMALIAGAAHALRYKATHPAASDDEALREVTKNAESLSRKLDTAH